MVMPRVFQHFGGRDMVTVTSDGVTHTATMQTGYSGTFQWQVNGVDVAGETGATFKPVPSLPSDAVVNVVVTDLVYTSKAIVIVNLIQSYLFGSADNYTAGSTDNYTAGAN